MKLKENRVLLDIVICITSLIGLILNFCLFKTPVSLLYYTIYSNLLCFIFYLYSIIKKLFFEFKLTKKYINLKSIVLVSLSTTFMIYNFIMVPSNMISAYDNHFIVSAFVHIITPLLVVIDCYINGKRVMLEYKNLYLYLIPMIIYGIMVIIYQHLGGMFPGGVNYPYFNFNYKEYGYFMCIIMNIISLIIYELIGLVVIVINRKSNKIGGNYGKTCI